MGALFGPRWRLTVGSLDVSDLDLAFHVERQLGHSPGTAVVKVWNLHDTSPIRVGETLALRAGFEDDGDPPPTIFVGDVRHADTREDKGHASDLVTEIHARDGGEQYFLARAARSYAPGTAIATAIRDLADDLGVGLGNLGQTVFAMRNGATSFPDGWAFQGPARSGLNTLLRACGLRWSIQHGALQILPRGRGAPGEIVLLTPDSGLIEAAPEEASNNPRTAARNRGKVKARCLLQGGLEPGRSVRIENRTLSGEYVIHKLTVEGDTTGDTWECELECRAPVIG